MRCSPRAFPLCVGAPPKRFDQSYEFGQAFGGLPGQSRLSRRAAPVLVQMDPVRPERLEPDVPAEPGPDRPELRLQHPERGFVVLGPALQVECHLQAAVPEPQLEVPAAFLVPDLEHAAHPGGLEVPEVGGKEGPELLVHVGVEVSERRDPRPLGRHAPYSRSMPELPEVQALAERLDEVLAGAELVAATALQFSALKTFDPPADAALGDVLQRVTRRGKYLVFELPELRILAHLSQGGRVDVEDPPKRTKPRG